MNQCSKIRIQLASYDAKPGSGETPEVLAHLSACADCRRAASDIRRIAARLREMPGPTLPITFDQGLQTKLAAVQTGREHGQKQTGLLAHWRAFFAPVRRRGFAALTLGTGLAATAAACIALLISPLHLRPEASLPLQHGPSAPAQLQQIAPLPASLPQSDADFIAACSSQHAQYASAQAVSDPSASALATDLDETRAAPSDDKDPDDAAPALVN